MTDEVAELQGEVLPEETTGEGVELEESPTSEVEETNQDDTPADDKPKAKGVQKRIDELTSNWRTAERDRDHWRELALKGEQKPVDEPASAPQGKPTLDAFESYEEYVEALADWKYEERQRSDRENQEKQRQAQTQAEKTRSFQQRAESVRETHPDFDQVVGNPALPISQAMADAAYSSEKGPEILYHLGQNPQEAEKLYNLSPIEAAMAIGRIEASLSRPARNKSSAPDPIEPVSGVGGTQTVDPDRMNMDQYAKWRLKQLNR